jgi:hypothetical protein
VGADDQLFGAGPQQHQTVDHQRKGIFVKRLAGVVLLRFGVVFVQVVGGLPGAGVFRAGWRTPLAG